MGAGGSPRVKGGEEQRRQSVLFKSQVGVSWSLPLPFSYCLHVIIVCSIDAPAAATSGRAVRGTEIGRISQRKVW